MTLLADRARLLRYLATGHVVIREDCGGSAGVRCRAAVRNGKDFGLAPDALVDRGGFTRNFVEYRLKEIGRHVFRADPVSAPPDLGDLR